MDPISIVDTIQGAVPWARAATSIMIALLLMEAIMVAGRRVSGLLIDLISDLTGRRPDKRCRRQIKAWVTLGVLVFAVVLTIGLLV